MGKVSNEVSIIFLLLNLFPLTKVLPQTFIIEGNVSTNSTVVKYSSVTIIDQRDVSKKYSANTNGRLLLQQNFELEYIRFDPFNTVTQQIRFQIHERKPISIALNDRPNKVVINLPNLEINRFK
ncbi:hypothetical protein LJE86_09035 [bacterium BMS3Abin03]|jgi:hypothetical protein|nr:hypothetical protein [bacterium BMS3Abin03]MCG6958817.1 hypothetical protein [bacterium BMS3Abin03]